MGRPGFGAKFLIIIAALALQACETFTPEDCLTADWAQLGYKAGAAGNLVDLAFDRYASVCAAAGFAADGAAFESGYKSGLDREYCTTGRAFSGGLKGGFATRLCPAYIAEAYYEGLEFRAEMAGPGARVDYAKDDYYHAREAVSKAKKPVRRLRSERDNPETSDTRKQDIAAELASAERILSDAFNRRERTKSYYDKQSRRCENYCYRILYRFRYASRSACSSFCD
ncbi:MAG: DUF2799 domain-containing protein [Pseudomonadota bacterium]